MNTNVLGALKAVLDATLILRFDPDQCLFGEYVVDSKELK